MESEYFKFKCPNPNCGLVTNAVDVAATLPDEVLIAEAARRNARRQTGHAGPGRPIISRCPGCDAKMSTLEMREHRIPCVRERLTKLQHRHVQLIPKDPDPHPDFMILRVNE